MRCYMKAKNKTKKKERKKERKDYKKIANGNIYLASLNLMHSFEDYYLH